MHTVGAQRSVSIFGARREQRESGGDGGEGWVERENAGSLPSLCRG